MIKWIKCPDKQLSIKEDCLSGKCRMGSRCAPLTYLQLSAREREWKGVPSVTQLIDGNRRQYLLLTTDTVLDPNSSAYRVLGTRGHTALDADNDSSFTEEHFDDGVIQGTTDMVEQQENGEWWLIDHKTAGSYKVQKALGLEKHETPILDEHGNQKKYKNGKPMVDREYLPTGKKDIADWQMQLNKYRIEMEKSLGEKISKIKIFCVVRDGNTFSAKNRGIVNNIYYIDIPLLLDTYVNEWFDKKRTALLNALESKTIPHECSAEECWDGNKCKLCEVREACALAGRTWEVKEEEDV